MPAPEAIQELVTLKQLKTRITATNRQIDRLVYQLYELTDEEIALVEQSG